MLRPRSIFFVLALALLVPGRVAYAVDAAAAEQERLRSALRDVTLQLRSAQSDLAAARAAQAAAEEKNQGLAAQYDALRKKADAEHSTDAKTVTALNAQLAERAKEIQQLERELAYAKSGWGNSAQAAQTAQAECVQLRAETAAQKKRLVSLEGKNVALFFVANDILTHFSDFSFATALKAKEPFVGATRARLETLVQDYRDQVLDQRDKP